MEKLTKALNTEHLFTEADVTNLLGEEGINTIYQHPKFRDVGPDGDYILVDYYAASNAIEYTIAKISDILDSMWKGNTILSEELFDLKRKLERYEDVWSN